MMLTTIFSGHTLDLNDIVTIGPVMRKSEMPNAMLCQLTLYLEIHLKYGASFRHNALTQQFYIEQTDKEVEEWYKATKVLESQRNELVADWERAKDLELGEKQISKQVKIDLDRFANSSPDQLEEMKLE